MIIVILKALLPLAIRIIIMALDKKILDETQAKAFIDFLQKMASGENQSKRSKEIFTDLHNQLLTKKATKRTV